MTASGEPLLAFWVRTQRANAGNILSASLVESHEQADKGTGRYPTADMHLEATGKWLESVRRPELELAKQAVCLLLPHLSTEILGESVESQRDILTTHLQSAGQRLGIVTIEALTDVPS